jgi:FG-GAP-like repeat
MRTIRLCAVGALIGFAVAPLRAGETDSLFPLRIITGQTTAIGDIDGDGILDFASAIPSSPNHKLSVNLGRGDGTFSLGTGTTATTAPYTVLAQDLDFDGHTDVVALPSFLGATSFAVSRGGPNGLLPAVAYSTAAKVSNVACLADVTNDGIADLISVFGQGQQVQVVRGLSGGGFGTTQSLTIPSILTLTEVRQPYAGDFDGDGDIDVAIDSNSGSSIVVLQNNSGALSPLSLSITPGEPESVLVGAADLNGDSRMDLLQLSRTTPTLPWRCRALIATPVAGAPAFTALTDVPSSAFYFQFSGASTAIRDINNDGRLDFVAIGHINDIEHAAVFLGAVTPSGFTTPMTFVMRGRAPALADFDGDNQLDLAAQAPGTSEAIVALDVGSVVAQYGAAPLEASNVTSGAIADVTGDGIVDVVTDSANKLDLVLHVGSASGVFPPPITIGPLPPTATPNYLKLRTVDYDHDSDLDVIAVRLESFGVFVNQGGGMFSALPTPAIAPLAWLEFDVANLVGDAFLDVVLPTTSGVTIHQGGANGFVATTTIPVPSQYVRAIAIGDYTGDGLLDIAAYGANSTRLYLIAATGAGAFAIVGDVAVPNVLNLAAGDLDGDGLDDCVAAIPGTDSFFVLRSNGNDFIAVQSFTASADPYADPRAHLADVTGDGHLDLVAFGGNYFGELRVHPGSASGLFDNQARRYTAPGGPDFTFVDVNGDGRLDVASTNTEYKAMFAFLGREGVDSVGKYGLGKPGTNGIPDLSAADAPFLGSTATLRLGNGLAGAVPHLVLGVQSAAIPFDGGQLLVAPLILTTLAPLSTTGSLDLLFVLPADPALVDLTIYWQYFFVDPLATGFLHTAQSNGLSWRLGF